MTTQALGPPGPGLVRAALTVSGWNALSRLTGFVRVIAVGAALGTTFLGNTYQSSNLVSNLTFELLAAGLLSAPLVGPFVGLIERGREKDAERLAGNLLGMAVVGLGVLVVVLAVAGHSVMRLLMSGVSDETVRSAEVRLGAFFLWFFLPQVLLYATGAVASALLVAHRRFAAAALAPVVNNLFVTVTMVTFMAMVNNDAPGLDLALGPRLVLALGTTGGVLAMAAVPVVALARRGFLLRPHIDLRDPQLLLVRRVGAWGVVLLGSAQGLIAVTLVLANRVEGGVIAYQMAYTFFLLPVALVAQPIFTTLHPRLASHAEAGQWDAYTDDIAAGVRVLMLLVIPATALLTVLAAPGLRLVRLGALEVDDVRLVANVLVAYAIGLTGFAVFQLLARAATAARYPHVPALAGVGVLVSGTVLMVLATSASSDRALVVTLGVAHSIAVTGGATVLLGLIGRRHHRAMNVWPSLARALAAGACVWAVGTVSVHALGPSGRVGAAVDLAVGGPLAVAAGLAALWVLNTPELRAWQGQRGLSMLHGDARKA